MPNYVLSTIIITVSHLLIRYNISQLNHENMLALNNCSNTFSYALLIPKFQSYFQWFSYVNKWVSDEYVCERVSEWWISWWEREWEGKWVIEWVSEVGREEERWDNVFMNLWEWLSEWLHASESEVTEWLNVLDLTDFIEWAIQSHS